MKKLNIKLKFSWCPWVGAYWETWPDPFRRDVWIAIVPFVVLHIVQESQIKFKSIWPSSLQECAEWADDEQKVESWIKMAEAIRGLRGVNKIKPKVKIPYICYEGILEHEGIEFIRHTTWAHNLVKGRPKTDYQSTICENVYFHLPMPEGKGESTIDKDKVQKRIDELTARLANDEFLTKAKPTIISATRKELEHLQKQINL